MALYRNGSQVDTPEQECKLLEIIVYEVFSYYDDEFLGEFFVIDPSSDSIMLDSNLLWVFLHDT